MYGFFQVNLRLIHLIDHTLHWKKSGAKRAPPLELFHGTYLSTTCGTILAPLSKVELLLPKKGPKIQGWQNGSTPGTVLENGATSEDGAIFFLNMIIKEKTAPPSKVAPFYKKKFWLHFFLSVYMYP